MERRRTFSGEFKLEAVKLATEQSGGDYSRLKLGVGERRLTA